MKNYLNILILLLGLPCITAWAADAANKETSLVNFALVQHPANKSVTAGVQQGLSESNVLGGFSGQEYRVEEVTLEQLAAATPDTAPMAIIAALPSADIDALAKRFENTPVFNVIDGDDDLRRLCLPNLFHTIASQRMLDDAVKQWKNKHPGANVEAATWHPDFKKYAGRELNNRFQKAQGRPMDSQSWATWTAVKLVADAVTRGAGSEPHRLLAFLKDDLAFGGNKGILLNFRATGQLRQPLWIIESGKVIGEAPVRGVTDVEDLDSLGLVDLTCK